MPTIAQQLQELVNQKAALATNLTTKGVQASSSEKLNTLVPKVLNIPTGTDTSDANATASDILSGKTGYVNGVKITGNISSKAAQTYIPTTSNQTIAAGQYLSGAQTIAGDVNLIASNVKRGVTIYGTTGTYGPVEEFILDTTSASSASDVYNDYGDDIIVYIRGDQFRTLNEIQDYSTTLKTQADIDRPSEYHPDPHWIYRTATTGGTAEENYGIMANNSSSNQDENAVYNTIWDFANISQTKRIMFLGKNKVHLDGTMTTFEYLATVRGYSSNGSLFVAFIQATDLAALKNKLDTDDFGTWQLLTFSPVMSGIAQDHAFYNFTPGDYYMVLGIEIDALTGFSLKKMGYYNI